MDRQMRAVKMQVNRLLRRNEKLEVELKAARAAYRELVSSKLDTLTTPEQLFRELQASWGRREGR